MSPALSARQGLGFVFIAAFLWVVSPLLIPVVMGAVFAVLMHPMHRRLVTGGKKRRSLPASISGLLLTLGLFLLVLLPIAILIFYVARTGIQEFEQYRASGGVVNTSLWTTFLDKPWAQNLVAKVSSIFPVSKETLLSSAQEIILSLGSKVAEILGKLAGAIPSLSMALVVMVLSLYFCLVDGEHCVQLARRLSPFRVEQTERLLKSVTLTCRSVILASLVAGVVQGLIFSFGCLVTGTPHWDLIGVIVFLASFIPLVGSMPVTVGIATYELFLGNTNAALWLYIFAGISGASDNLIRPMFLKGAANLHPMIAFIAALGGIQMLGFFGIFLGPILASAFLVSLQFILENSAES